MPLINCSCGRAKCAHMPAHMPIMFEKFMNVMIENYCASVEFAPPGRISCVYLSYYENEKHHELSEIFDDIESAKQFIADQLKLDPSQRSKPVAIY